jgi:hypothetical protein
MTKIPPNPLSVVDRIFTWAKRNTACHGSHQARNKTDIITNKLSLSNNTNHLPVCRFTVMQRKNHNDTSLISFPYLCKAIFIAFTTYDYIAQVTKMHTGCGKQLIPPHHTLNGAASETTTGSFISMELSGCNYHSLTGTPCLCTAGVN